jgi:hypothetical protein
MSDEKALWCAVISQALTDATLPLNTPNASIRLERNQARSWFTHPNQDFAEVCHLAGLDPVRVRNSALKLIEAADKAQPQSAAVEQPKPKRQRKRRQSIYVVNGRSMSISGWAKEIGVNPVTIYDRLNRGWSVEDALTTPANATPANKQPRKRQARQYEYKGRSLTLDQWSAETGIKRATLVARLNKGWTIERAIKTPPNYTPGVGQPNRYCACDRDHSPAQDSPKLEIS